VRYYSLQFKYLEQFFYIRHENQAVFVQRIRRMQPYESRFLLTVGYPVNDYAFFFVYDDKRFPFAEQQFSLPGHGFRFPAYQYIPRRIAAVGAVVHAVAPHFEAHVAPFASAFRNDRQRGQSVKICTVVKPVKVFRLRVPANQGRIHRLFAGVCRCFQFLPARVLNHLSASRNQPFDIQIGITVRDFLNNFGPDGRASGRKISQRYSDRFLETVSARALVCRKFPQSFFCIHLFLDFFIHEYFFILEYFFLSTNFFIHELHEWHEFF
jgi:hypothetical protein